MRINFSFLIIIFLFLQQCGYSPIYLNIKDKNINLNIIEISGNDTMNTIVNTGIKKYQNNSAATNINLNVKTYFKKNILTKNKAGKATSYSLTKTIEFEITNLENPQKYFFEEETKTSSMVSEFEFKNYEKAIITNFINNKLEELIFKLPNPK